MWAEAVKYVVPTIFSTQNALRELAPEFKWAGLGNLLGDYGKYVCIKKYGLIKATAGARNYDVTTSDGKSVQIKTNHAANMIGYHGKADLMLVIHVSDDGEFEEIYYGDFEPGENASNFSKRDNKKTITISKLRKLNAELHAS